MSPLISLHLRLSPTFSYLLQLSPIFKSCFLPHQWGKFLINYPSYLFSLQHWLLTSSVFSGTCYFCLHILLIVVWPGLGRKGQHLDLNGLICITLGSWSCQLWYQHPSWALTLLWRPLSMTNPPDARCMPNTALRLGHWHVYKTLEVMENLVNINTNHPHFSNGVLQTQTPHKPSHYITHRCTHSCCSKLCMHH